MKFFISFVFLCMCRSIFGETFPQCENLESGAFVGGTSGCKSYIYCDGEDSYEGVCPSQLLFNTKDGSCAPASEVDCVDGNVPPALATSPATTTATTTTTTTTPIPTTTTTTRTTTTTVKESTTKPSTAIVTTTASPISLAAEVPAEISIDFVEETPEESAEIHTEDKESFPAAVAVGTTPGAPLTTVFVDQTRGSTSGPALSCPDVDRPNEVVFIPSADSCNEYFLCYHGTPVQMSCSGQLFFDYLISKCELPERVNCLVSSATTPNPKKQCTVNTFDFFPYPNNCNYFYKCINGFLSLQQCPVGFGWSDEMKLCVKLSDGRCPMGRLGQLPSSYGW